MAKNENREYLERVREELRQYYNGEIINDDEEQMSMYDYLADVLDYEYTINSSREYISCKVWITLGGPNIWIDTRLHTIELAWGSDRDSLYLDYEICDEIDSIMEEYYNM